MAEQTKRELQERHNKLVKDAQELLDSREAAGEKVSAEDTANFDKYMAEAAEIREDIAGREARAEQLREANEFTVEHVPDTLQAERRMLENVRDPEERAEIRRTAMNKVIRNWHVGYVEDLKPESLTDLERQAVRYTTRHHPSDAELRAAQQSIGTSGAGGVLVASEWQRSILTQAKAYGGMRRVANVIRTGTGGTLNIPTSDDTGNVATIIGEATTGGTTHVPFDLVALEAAKYKSGPIKMSIEVLQDSIIDLEAYVRGRLAERFGRGTEAHFATRSSTEAAGPHGIVNESTGAVVVVGTTASPFTFDQLKDLYHSVDPAYRDRASVAWMFNDTTLAAISKIKDTTGQYLWQPGLQGPMANSLLGKPFVINQHLASYVAGGTSTGPKPIWFGDWSHYAIRDVMPLSLFRFNERYLNEGNFGVIGFGRFDGRATFASTTPANKPIRCIIQTT